MNLSGDEIAAVRRHAEKALPAAATGSPDFGEDRLQGRSDHPPVLEIALDCGPGVDGLSHAVGQHGTTVPATGHAVVIGARLAEVLGQERQRGWPTKFKAGVVALAAVAGPTSWNLPTGRFSTTHLGRNDQQAVRLRFPKRSLAIAIGEPRSTSGAVTPR